MKKDSINKMSGGKYLQNRIKGTYFHLFRYRLGCGMCANCVLWKMKTCIRDLQARVYIYQKWIDQILI